MWIDVLGRAFVEYTLADPGLVLTLAGDARRRQIVEEAGDLVAEQGARGGSPRDVRMSLLHELLAFHSGAPRVSSWRIELGAASGRPEPGDEVLDLLTDIAHHCYPALLAKYHTVGDEPDGAPIASIAWSHPRFVDAVAAVVDVLGLPVDFAAVTLPHEANFEAVWVPYSAGSIQAVGLVPAIVQYALLLWLLDGARDETLLRIHVEQSLDCARDLAAGRPTDLPTVTVLRRFTAEPGSDLPQSPVRLTWADPLAALVPCQIPAGGIAVVHWSRSRFEVVRPEQVPLGETPREARARRWVHRQGEVHKAVAERRRIVDRVRVALMLCPRKGRTSAPDIAGQATFAPLPLAGQMMVRFDLGEPLDSVLGQAELYEFSGHVSRLLELPAGLDFGFERLLEGLTHSPSPVDVLVNAVLFWESLFGSRSETTFRVCGAMARLLKPGDYDAAHELYRDLSAIYDARSRAVHGESGGVWIDTHRLAERAIGIDRDVLRAVLSRRDLRTARDASERSLRVLLS